MSPNKVQEILAANGIEITTRGIIQWCTRKGLGVKRAGRWYLDPVKVAAHVALPVEIFDKP